MLEKHPGTDHNSVHKSSEAIDKDVNPLLRVQFTLELAKQDISTTDEYI